MAQAILAGGFGLALAIGLPGEAGERPTGAPQLAPPASARFDGPDAAAIDLALGQAWARLELAPGRASARAREVSLVERHGGAETAAAPSVAVRAGKHPGFARIVFDWPEAISYEVVRRSEQVIVVFDRPGRIDLSGLGGRVGIEARSDGAVSRRVIVRIPPDAQIRSSRLEGDRVVLDVLDGALPPPDPVPAAPAAAADPVAELRQVVRERDAVIESLLARVSRLEARPVLASADLDRVTAGETDSSTGPASAPSPAASGPPTAGQGDADGAPAAPGSFEVDEKEIDRALERTLVQTGVLLLPFGQAEIEPSFSYTRQETDSPTFVTNDGNTFVGEQKVRRNEYEVGMDLRFGLPLDSQFELGLPYRFVDQSTAMEVGFNTLEGTDGSGSGVGDLRVGLAKTLLREKHWWPDLVGRLTWDTGTGETTDNDVVLGGGFHALRGSLSAVKRQDPLAFTAGLSYETTFENNDVKPGDEFGFAIGAALAASPETSLHVGFDQRFGDEVKVDGESVSGSDTVVGTASVGASVIIDHGALLDVTLDVGLTEDAPDYAVRVSLPIRFNLPTF